MQVMQTDHADRQQKLAALLQLYEDAVRNREECEGTENFLLREVRRQQVLVQEVK